MSENKIDISRASKAIRDSRFVEALSMLESNLAKDLTNSTGVAFPS